MSEMKQHTHETPKTVGEWNRAFLLIDKLLKL